MTDKPWMKQPGQCHDEKGVPIYPGDLLKTFHFKDRRRRNHYLYHTAVYINGAMRITPTCHLEPTKAGGGGDCLLSQEDASNTEVIYGQGPRPFLDFTDRPKVKVPA